MMAGVSTEKKTVNNIPNLLKNKKMELLDMVKKKELLDMVKVRVTEASCTTHKEEGILQENSGVML